MTVTFETDLGVVLDAWMGVLFVWVVMLGVGGWFAWMVVQRRQRSREKREVGRMVEVLRAKKERR